MEDPCGGYVYFVFEIRWLGFFILGEIHDLPEQDEEHTGANICTNRGVEFHSLMHRDLEGLRNANAQDTG